MSFVGIEVPDVTSVLDVEDTFCSDLFQVLEEGRVHFCVLNTINRRSGWYPLVVPLVQDKCKVLHTCYAKGGCKNHSTRDLPRSSNCCDLFSKQIFKSRRQ